MKFIDTRIISEMNEAYLLQRPPLMQTQYFLLRTKAGA